MNNLIGWLIFLAVVGLAVYAAMTSIKASAWKIIGRVTVLSIYLLLIGLYVFMTVTERFSIDPTRVFLLIALPLLCIMEWQRYQWKIYRYVAVAGLSVYSIAFYSSRGVSTSTRPNNRDIASYTISEYEEMLSSFGKNDVFTKNNFITNKRYHVFGVQVSDAEYTELRIYSYFVFLYITYLLIVNAKDVLAFFKQKMSQTNEAPLD